MSRPRRRSLFAVTVLLAFAACRPAPAASTVVPGTGVPFAEATGTPAASPDLSHFAWDDRSPFRAGLVQSQQAVLAALPGAAVYHIAITLTQSLDTVQGREAVQYTNQTGAALDQVLFHLYPNLLAGSISVSDVSLDGKAAQATLDQRGTILRVPLAVPLAPNGRVVVAMGFEVAVPHDLQRNYGVFSYNQNILALAHFFPMVAEYDQRGWNVEIPSPFGDVTYSDATFYLVQVRAPSALVVAGSGSLINRQVPGAGEQLLTFAAGPARDFYLSVSPDYVVVSEKIGEIAVNSYAPTGHEAEARSVLQTAEAALEDYGARYGAYPYTELDVAATSTLALGIEYPGIVAITLRVYDSNADFGGTPVSVMRESTVAHELGHQWFYNMVGNDQLDQPWLDEALVQYVTWRYYAHRYGQGGDDGFRQSLEARWKRADKPDMPIGLPVSAYTAAEYGAIVYGRGPIFFATLAQKLGQANMDAFLSDYAHTFQWKIATTAGLKQLAEQHCGCDLTALFQEWIYP